MPANQNGTTALPVVPTVLWAQRDDKVFLTVAVDDVDKPEIRIEDNSLFFRGTGNKTVYELNVEFYKPLKKSECKYGIYAQKHWMFILQKESKGPYWPRLLKDSKKVHWLKADWNKWRDEDEEDENEGPGGAGGEFDNMFQQMGGMGGMGGMAGMGGMGGGMGGMENYVPDLNDIDQADETDSDDEKLPDLEENTKPNTTA